MGMWHHLVEYFQVCSKFAPRAIDGPNAGVIKAYIISTFSEYGHVAYQMKGNETNYNMLANVLPLHTPLTPGVQKVFFLKVVMVHVKLMGMIQRTQFKQIFCPFIHP